MIDFCLVGQSFQSFGVVDVANDLLFKELHASVALVLSLLGDGVENNKKAAETHLLHVDKTCRFWC